MGSARKLNEILVANAVAELSDSQFLSWAAITLGDTAEESGSVLAEYTASRIELIALRLEAIDALEDGSE